MMQKLVKFNIYLIKNAFSKLAVNKRDYLSLVSVKVIPSCPTLCDPMDYTVHRNLQDRILERIAFPFSRGSSQPGAQTKASCIAGGLFPS